ncbi:MAG: 4Fe-4S binding protein [Spirochaetaceae bacterium]|jgi:2-oxoglutarate ferredoxin oxidoreductase subunit delta|nr:4Fe-4S binding protein [Spirochaetaceae bacterium]
MAAKGEPLINSERCKGCGLCIANCPKNILEMSKEFNSDGVTFPTLNDEETCTACTFCATMCPENAIQIRRF